MPANPSTIGKLRTRLRLQSRSETRTASGGVTEGWTTDTILWAAVFPASGREFIQAARQDATVTHRVIIRHQDSITINPTKRFLFDSDTSRALNIQTVWDEYERGRWFVCDCVEDA